MCEDLELQELIDTQNDEIDFTESHTVTPSDEFAKYVIGKMSEIKTTNMSQYEIHKCVDNVINEYYKMLESK